MFAENDEDDVDQNASSSFLKVYKEGQEPEVEQEKKLTKDQVKFSEDDVQDEVEGEQKDKSLLIAEIGSQTFDQNGKKS